MISERVLRKWRADSLKELKEIHSRSTKIIDKIGTTAILNERILKLTQELLDQHLIRKG